MSEVTTAAPAHLVDRTPRITGAEIVATLVPPPQFANATFETFRPDPAHPSQEEARSTLQAFTAPKVAPSKGNGFFGFGKKRNPLSRLIVHRRQLNQVFISMVASVLVKRTSSRQRGTLKPEPNISVRLLNTLR